MRRPRHRPGAIRWFVALFLVSAICGYIDGLRDLDRMTAFFAQKMTDLHFDRDATIVLLSARLSIALIPTALIWFFASNVARWMVAVIALGKLTNIPGAVSILGRGDALSPWWSASLLLGLIAVCLLFSRASRRYFAKDEPVDHAVFD